MSYFVIDCEKNRCPHLRTNSLSKLYRNDGKRSGNNHPNVVSCLFLVADDIFMKKTPIGFSRFPQCNLDSTSRSQNVDKIFGKISSKLHFSTNDSRSSNRFSVPKNPLPKLSNAPLLGRELAPHVGVRGPFRRRGSGNNGLFKYRLNS